MARDLPPRARFEARHRPIASAIAALLLAAALTACAPETVPDPTSSPTVTATTAQPGPSSTPESPAEATLMPDGTAADNLPLFAAVTAAVWASEGRVTGRAYVDALAAAGFDKAAMQVTADQTTVGNPAESIQFAVRWGDECLVGQVGPATGNPVTVVVPVLAEGTCLVGQTRPIDW
ncbi:hypothetical protein Q9R08_06490 [Microbacterium sp. QXD-8]|uniref:DUF6993 domain-containing protein n=1 Tax=Microbacterium psychrotolerans TaxID=3068321 RepID=A0ABU0Z198_9MICO|nr:hypothetical protein [Microbacterium sp. QXD-8]MDQ7877619.1 hypothetical protein [Microbacterium sp. QXD-8]